MSVGEHGYETPDYWEGVYAGEPWNWAVDALLPEIAAGLTPGAALDIGCGEGQNCRFLAGRGWDVLGIDFSPTAIGRARERAVPGTTFAVADARVWKPDSQFDLVISTYALGSRRDAILPMAAEAVAPGGIAYVAEFDESTENLWPPEDLVSVDELIAAFEGFDLLRAEVVNLPHQHDRHENEWPMAVVVAGRPV